MPDNKYPQYGDDARRVFIEGKTAKEIAQILPISDKTVGEWAVLGDWKDDRKKARSQFSSDEETVKTLMRKFLAELSNKPMSQVRPADVDMLAKLTSTLRSIQSMLDPKAATLLVMRKFLEFVAGKDKELHQSLLEIIPEFFEIMGR
jgi:hypothetical protein